MHEITIEISDGALVGGQEETTMSPGGLFDSSDFYQFDDMPIFAHEIDEKGVEEKIKGIVTSVSEQLDEEEPKVRQKIADFLKCILKVSTVLTYYGMEILLRKDGSLLE